MNSAASLLFFLILKDFEILSQKAPQTLMKKIFEEILPLFTANLL